LSPFFNR